MTCFHTPIATLLPECCELHERTAQWRQGGVDGVDGDPAETRQPGNMKRRV